MNNRTYWALGVDLGNDQGTKTVESFVLLSSAIDALKNIDDESAFIDQWVFNGHSDDQLDQYITKKDLNKILNKTFICEE